MAQASADLIIVPGIETYRQVLFPQGIADSLIRLYLEPVSYAADIGVKGRYVGIDSHRPHPSLQSLCQLLCFGILREGNGSIVPVWVQLKMKNGSITAPLLDENFDYIRETITRCRNSSVITNTSAESMTNSLAVSCLGLESLTDVVFESVAQYESGGIVLVYRSVV